MLYHKEKKKAERVFCMHLKFIDLNQQWQDGLNIQGEKISEIERERGRAAQPFNDWHCSLSLRVPQTKIDSDATFAHLLDTMTLR